MTLALLALLFLAGMLLWVRISHANDVPQPGMGALRNLGLVKFAKRYTFLIDPQGKLAKSYLKVEPRAIRRKSSTIWHG